MIQARVSRIEFTKSSRIEFTRGKIWFGRTQRSEPCPVVKDFNVTGIAARDYFAQWTEPCPQHIIELTANGESLVVEDGQSGWQGRISEWSDQVEFTLDITSTVEDAHELERTVTAVGAITISAVGMAIIICLFYLEAPSKYREYY